MLEGGSVMAECGPMRLVISSFIGKVPQREMNVQAARASFVYLERVARMQDTLRRIQTRVKPDLEEPLAVEMVRNVLAVGDADLTPMAAVAGTIGDAVADYLFRRGMTRVVVNNGGDIAIRLQDEEPVRVGIRTDVNNSDFDDVLVLGPGCGSWGVATSGLGGRSLTRGVASAATIVAPTASLADAAATAVANASFVEDEQIVQRYAEEVDPNTDIRGIPVTVKVGRISPEKGRVAVSKAMDRAEELVGRGIILGALIAVDGQIGMTSFLTERLAGGRRGA
jgi:hypothetical protein